MQRVSLGAGGLSLILHFGFAVLLIEHAVLPAPVPQDVSVTVSMENPSIAAMSLPVAASTPVPPAADPTSDPVAAPSTPAAALVPPDAQRLAPIEAPAIRAAEAAPVSQDVPPAPLAPPAPSTPLPSSPSPDAAPEQQAPPATASIPGESTVPDGSVDRQIAAVDEPRPASVPPPPEDAKLAPAPSGGLMAEGRPTEPGLPPAVPDQSAEARSQPQSGVAREAAPAAIMAAPARPDSLLADGGGGPAMAVQPPAMAPLPDPRATDPAPVSEDQLHAASPALEPPASPVPVPPIVEPQVVTGVVTGEVSAAMRETPRAVKDVIGFIDRYDGGRCVFVALRRITGNSVDIDGFADSDKSLNAFDAAFLAATGLESSVTGRRVWKPQCPVLDFLNDARSDDGAAPDIEIDQDRLRDGDVLSGTVRVSGALHVTLLLVSEKGSVDNVTGQLSDRGRAKGFSLTLRHARAEGAPFPQMLLAIASVDPLPAASLPASTRDDGFRLLTNRASNTASKLRAAVKSFLIDQ